VREVRVRALAVRGTACEIRGVPTSPRAPYSVSLIPFRFVALASLAGSLPLGHGRESALAALLVARLAAAALAGDAVPAALAKRVEGTRGWLPSLCPDRAVRRATLDVCEAVLGGERAQILTAIGNVIDVTSPILSVGARAELVALAAFPS
jgi:hypothetical protein